MLETSSKFMLFTSKLMVIFRSGFGLIGSGCDLIVSGYDLRDLVDLVDFVDLDLISMPLSRHFNFSLLGLRDGAYSC